MRDLELHVEGARGAAVETGEAGGEVTLGKGKGAGEVMSEVYGGAFVGVAGKKGGLLRGGVCRRCRADGEVVGVGDGGPGTLRGAQRGFFRDLVVLQRRDDEGDAVLVGTAVAWSDHHDEAVIVGAVDPVPDALGVAEGGVV